ncbi:hypothetical protein F9912_21610, partial [Mycobacterium tuberculosis]
NARDQPPAEVSDQRVSGLTGAVHGVRARGGGCGVQPLRAGYVPSQSVLCPNCLQLTVVPHLKFQM